MSRDFFRNRSALGSIPQMPSIPQFVWSLQPGPETGNDTYIASAYYPADNYANLDSMRLGGWGDTYYALLKFDISNLPPASAVTSAKVRLFNHNSANQGSFTTDRITADWTATGVTWNNRPASTQVVGSITPEMNAFVEIDITQLYKDWKNGVLPNYGLMFKPTSTSNMWTRFRTSNYLENVAQRPQLILT